MSKFLRVKCDCGEESVVFGDSKTSVNCAKCGTQIIKSSGGRALVNCRILEVLS
ncbi:MAG: 30S ribosomal protein S27e [Candidatus Micrarchaeota archaeon]|nr:30S ribosomal protein S27e [Candidatus Micrarchaeota archaeon]